VTVRVYVPLKEVGTDKIVDPEPETVLGLKELVSPPGEEVMLKLTGPLNPFEPLTATVYVATVPALTELLVGVRVIEKSAAGAVEFTVCPKTGDVLLL
jgi:hypothetical protein